MAKLFGIAVSQGVVSPNQAQFRVETKNVAVAGTPEQIQSIPIPDGIEVIIRAKPSNGRKKIFVANSSPNALDPTKRSELIGGEGISLSITNANLVWLDAEISGHGVEIIAEA